LLAARAGEVEGLHKALSRGASVDETSAYGWTALMFAAWKGHEDVIEILLDAGADPNLVSEWVAKNTQAPLPETTALAEALENGHLSIARVLLARGATPDSVSVAIAGGLEDLSLLQQMHASGAKLSDNPGNMYHYSAMREACHHGRIANVRWLMEQGVSADVNDLKSAVGQSHFDLVRLLIQSGEGRSRFSQRALSEAFVFAATKRNPGPNPKEGLRIIEYLLAQGADPQFRPDSGEVKGRTAVEFLTKKSNLARDLIEKNRYGETHQAADQAWLDHMQSVIQLIEAGSR
jgi:ankyrin repeat protein